MLVQDFNDCSESYPIETISIGQFQHNTNFSNHNDYVNHNHITFINNNVLYNTFNINEQNSLPLSLNIFDNYQISNSHEFSYLNKSKPRKKPMFKPHYKWSKEEDEKLKKLVIEYGENDWRHLAKKMDERNSRQCRERWNYYLNPKLKHGKWTEEEDSLIIEKYQEIGPRWMEISKLFENRTDAMIKNRYNYLIRYQKRQNKKALNNSNFDFKPRHISFNSFDTPEPIKATEIFTSFLFSDKNELDSGIDFSIELSDEQSNFNYEDGSISNEFLDLDDFFS